MSARPPVVLALRALGLGDLLTAVPALRALRRARPDARLVLATQGWLGPVVEWTGAADSLLPARPLAPLPDPPAVDLAVNLHGSGPQSHRVLQALPGAPPLIAFANAEAGVDGPPWHEDEHERVRWCRLLEAHGIPADPGDLALPPPPGTTAPGPGSPVVIHPGAATGAKRWPVERWAAVARALAADGVPVVVTGSAEEVPMAAEVAGLAGLPPAAVLAGRTDPLGLARVIAGARALCSGDTGAAHLAVALGRPSVTLFGPTDPSRWGPPPGSARHRVLWAGEGGDPFAGAPSPGLLRLTPADVLTALAQAAGTVRREVGQVPVGLPAPEGTGVPRSAGSTLVP